MLQFTNQLLSSVENFSSASGGSITSRFQMIMEDNQRPRYRDRINVRSSRIPFESTEYEDNYLV